MKKNSFLWLALSLLLLALPAVQTSALDEEVEIELMEISGFMPELRWYNPGILCYIHNEAQTDISTIYHALNVDVYSLDALRYSLHSEGIDDLYCYGAYEYFHYWN